MEAKTITISRQAVMDVLIEWKNIRKKFSVMHDVKVNTRNQLSEGVWKLICKPNTKFSGVCLPPTNWNFEAWQKMYNQSRKQRLVMAAAMLICEIERIEVD